MTGVTDRWREGERARMLLSKSPAKSFSDGEEKRFVSMTEENGEAVASFS